jgi:putative transposase
MRTLNLRKMRWIVREMGKGELSVYNIAKQQGITPQYARRIYQRYKNVPLYKLNGEICLKSCGRKAKPFTKEEIDSVVTVRKHMGFGATNIEKVLLEKGVRIPHNRIHAILLSQNLAKLEPKKSRRRKWIRYQRRHSNSLWHTDWSEYRGQNIIIYIDDASRLITGYGMFKSATTDNTLKIYDEAVLNWNRPKAVMSDHGAQFCTDENDNFRFRDHLKSTGTKHILARVKHPQSNGKVERAFRTIKKLIVLKGNLDTAIKFYNEERPHMSLENGHLRTPLTAFWEKNVTINR